MCFYGDHTHTAHTKFFLACSSTFSRLKRGRQDGTRSNWIGLNLDRKRLADRGEKGLIFIFLIVCLRYSGILGFSFFGLLWTSLFCSLLGSGDWISGTGLDCTDLYRGLKKEETVIKWYLLLSLYTLTVWMHKDEHLLFWHHFWFQYPAENNWMPKSSFHSRNLLHCGIDWWEQDAGSIWRYHLHLVRCHSRSLHSHIIEHISYLFIIVFVMDFVNAKFSFGHWSFRTWLLNVFIFWISFTVEVL